MINRKMINLPRKLRSGNVNTKLEWPKAKPSLTLPSKLISKSSLAVRKHEKQDCQAARTALTWKVTYELAHIKYSTFLPAHISTRIMILNNMTKSKMKNTLVFYQRELQDLQWKQHPDVYKLKIISISEQETVHKTTDLVTNIFK